MIVYGPYDQAELDRQYDNRTRVPDFQDAIDRWAADSAAVRAGPGARLDLAYGAGERERLDIFPAADGAPVLVFLHGGYWRSLDKNTFAFVAPAWNAAGVSVVTVTYPLCPAATMDELVDAVRRAFVWLAREGGEHGLDTGRIHVAGHSAGGHLTAETMSTDWMAIDLGLPGDLIKGGCAISGLYDLEPIRLSYLNQDLRLDVESAHRNSPLRHLPKRAGPLILTVGGAESDEYHRQQNDYEAAWRRAGHPATVVDVPGHNHFTVLDLLADRESALFAAVAALIGHPQGAENP
jgi:arylformamidase